MIIQMNECYYHGKQINYVFFFLLSQSILTRDWMIEWLELWACLVQ